MRRGARGPRGLACARAALVALALCAAACRPQAEDQDLDFRATVSTAEVVKGRVERTLETTGTVRARHEAKVMPELPGKLTIGKHAKTGERLAVGDAVTRGQLIATVSSDRVATAARIRARKQALEAAEAEHRRKVSLHEQGLVPALDVEQARTQLDSAQAEYESVLVTDEKSRLVSPLSGVLAKVTTASDGELVSASTVIAEVMDFRDVIVDLDLGGGDVAVVRPGQVARVTGLGTAAPLPGRVERVAPAVDPASRTLHVEVSVRNPDAALRPGMFVRAEVVLDAREDVLVVPTEALMAKDGRLKVFVVEAQSAKLREVEIGLTQEEASEVVKGLAAGEKVVVSGQDTLEDGARVIERT